MSVTQGHSLGKAFDAWHCRNAVESPFMHVKGNCMQQQQDNRVKSGLHTGVMKLRAPADPGTIQMCTLSEQSQI